MAVTVAFAGADLKSRFGRADVSFVICLPLFLAVLNS